MEPRRAPEKPDYDFMAPLSQTSDIDLELPFEVEFRNRTSFQDETFDIYCLYDHEPTDDPRKRRCGMAENIILQFMPEESAEPEQMVLTEVVSSDAALSDVAPSEVATTEVATTEEAPSEVAPPVVASTEVVFPGTVSSAKVDDSDEEEKSFLHLEDDTIQEVDDLDEYHRGLLQTTISPTSCFKPSFRRQTNTLPQIKPRLNPRHDSKPFTINPPPKSRRRPKNLVLAHNRQIPAEEFNRESFWFVEEENRTPRVTLTRYDLRADEKEIYGWKGNALSA
ncbi:hypothetical protein QQS21_005719 [Conoideocrella luteorostrata]|uniref:Uncharacterized protein n=1 Tax=Conoideocrella luteorostrata TaxID=1105319 RepID=A0AAJ0CRR3_9HYPO|nr:hypothetical protein QQS21_005719 [Conoideocrella luteorostrata]